MALPGRMPPRPPSSHPDSPGLLKSLLLAPLNITLALLTTFLSSLRPYAPKLVPLVIFSSFIPITVLLSVCAGLFVWSGLSVSWEVPLYLQYGDGGNPYAYVQLPSLTASQRYDISMDLVLPCTDANLALGNFMTALTLSTSPANKTLAYVRRPTLASKPDSFFTLSKTTKRVVVPLIESFVAPKSRLAAFVEVGRADRWTSVGAGVGREVSVASATLRGLVVPHGIRGIAIRFPLLSSFIASALFFTILTLILGTCVLPLVLPEPSDDFEDEFGPGSGVGFGSGQGQVNQNGAGAVKVKVKVEPKTEAEGEGDGKNNVKGEKSEPASSRSRERERERERRARRRSKRRSRSGKSGDEEEDKIKTEEDLEEEPAEILLSAVGEGTSANRGLRRRTSRPSGIEESASPSHSPSRSP